MSNLDKTQLDLIMDDIVGRTEWNGETYADDRSFDNVETAYQLALNLIDRIYKNATLAPNAVATGSGKRLNKQAKRMIEYIAEICREVELDV